GVVALRIEASPDAMWVWPQKIRLKGRALFRAPMVKNDRHGASRRRGLSRLSASAARATRPNTTVKGPKEPSATLAKKNDPTHSTESDTSQNHTRHVMARRWRIAAARVYPAAASNLCLVSAGPSTDSTSKMPGDAVEP